MKPSLMKFAAGAFALSLASPSYAGAIVGATEFTQIANNIELAGAYSEQVTQSLQQQEMLTNQINAYRVQVQNTKRLDELNWANATGVLNDLAKNTRKMNGYAYAFATQDEAYKTLHKDYEKFVHTDLKQADYSKVYREWSAFNTEAATRAAKSAGLALADVDSEASRIEAIKRAGATADGQVQAIMAGNALSAELLDQMRILKQLLAQQIEAQSRYQLIEQEKENKDTAQEAAVMDDADQDLPAAKSYGQMK